MFFRRRAPRLWSKIGFRRVGRGASLPATPYSFVDGHHVFGTKWVFGRLGVVLRSPQRLVLPSTGTTSLRANGASAGWAWCFAPRKTLFFRRRAPRLRDKMGLRPVGRGASLPATPCSSVDGHHVFGAKSDFSRLGVVLRSPQNHILPSTGTTSLEQNRISAGWAWCFAPRKTLFFRRRAPRLRDKMGLRPVGRGASLPATPCSSVDGHHVFGTKWVFGRLVVVLRSLQRLILSSSGTTALEQNRISAGWSWCFAPRKTLFFRRRAPRQHAHLNEEPASGKKSQFQLTLMKSDEAIKVSYIIANSFLFIETCPWDFNSFHSLNVNATTISNSVNVGL